MSDSAYVIQSPVSDGSEANREGLRAATKLMEEAGALALVGAKEHGIRVRFELDPAVDLVLVDGRFRVACALQALAHCQPHTVLLIHDFWNRTPYHPVLAFTDWLGSCDTLAILRRKPAIDRDKLAQALQAHRLQPM